jgi:hypothetical protein
MAQTTDGLSMVDCQIEYSTNGADYTDISGFGGSVEGTEQTRQTGLVYTFDGDTAIIRAGKREPLELQFNIVYTEGTGDPWEILRPYFEAGSAVYFRWSPKGGDSTEFQFTTDAGYITSFPYPGGTAEGGDPIMGTWTHQTPKVTKAAVA